MDTLYAPVGALRAERVCADCGGRNFVEDHAAGDIVCNVRQQSIMQAVAGICSKRNSSAACGLYLSRRYNLLQRAFVCSSSWCMHAVLRLLVCRYAAQLRLQSQASYACAAAGSQQAQQQ
jgi:hypothetical protein